MNTRQRRLDRITQLINRLSGDDTGKRGLASLIGHTGFDDGGGEKPGVGLATLLSDREWRDLDNTN